MKSKSALVIAIGSILFFAIVAVSSVQALRSGVYFAAWRIYTDTPIDKGFAVNGAARISYTAYGAGPPLVLLHGGLSSSLDWVGEIPALSQIFRIIVIDLRGHAASSIGNEEFTYSLLATDVAVVLDSLGIKRASIAGWSDGGNVGLLFALNHPTRIDRLIAISANFNPEGVSDDVMNQVVDAPDQAGSPLARWLYRFQSASPGMWPILQGRVTRMWQCCPTLTVEDLKRVSAPTVLIVGARDDIDQEHSQAMKAGIPGAQLIVIPDTGHSIPRDVPDILIDEITNFLDGARE
jgi:pimeloyl-ACP methyl ester carboxylesterase